MDLRTIPLRLEHFYCAMQEQGNGLHHPSMRDIWKSDYENDYLPNYKQWHIENIYIKNFMKGNIEQKELEEKIIY